MAFACTRSKTKDEIYCNDSLKQRISQSTGDNMELVNMNLTDQDIPLIIQKVIRKKKSAASLSLANNQITADGVRMLVDALKTNQKLTHLTLSENPIGDESVKYLTQLISNSRTLYHLGLNGTNITDQGAKQLAETLRSNRTFLRCLDLRSNPSITDISLDVLLEMLEKNETLSACRLDNCGLSQTGKEKLREASKMR